MLDIAEKSFMRIAEAILSKNLTVREVFAGCITKEKT